MHLHRYLDSIEIKWLNEQAAQTVEYRGALDERALAEAYRLLCDRYPILRARVRRDSRGHLLEVADEHRPTLQIRSGDPKQVRHELGQMHDPADGVSRLTLIVGDSGGAVALHTYLFAVDGRSWLPMFYDLWELYTGIAAGRPAAAAATHASLPAPPSRVLDRIGVAADYHGTPSPMSPAIQAERRLTADETSRLRAAAHDTGTSVHALICGAALLAHREADAAPGRAAMACLSAVDLRDRLGAHVGTTDTTRFIGWHQCQMTVAPDDDPATVGRDVKLDLERAVRAGQLPLLRPNPSLDSTLDPRLSTVLTTNIGVVPPLNHPPEIAIVWWTRVYPTTGLDIPWHGFFTFRGELTVLSTYPADEFTEADSEQLTRRIASHLRDTAAIAHR